MSAGGWVACAAAVALLGCGDGMMLQELAQPKPASTAGCDQPLATYCSSPSRCPSYEESVASVRAYAASPGCFSAAIGTCGEFRYTRHSDGYVGATLYFNADGIVVAVVTTTDAINPGSACPGYTHYGPRLACTPVVEDKLCPR